MFPLRSLLLFVFVRYQRGLILQIAAKLRICGLKGILPECVLVHFNKSSSKAKAHSMGRRRTLQDTNWELKSIDMTFHHIWHHTVILPVAGC
jgi:hypothetical protein